MLIDLNLVEQTSRWIKAGKTMKKFKSYLTESNEDIHEESEYQGKKVTLNKPFRTPDGPKKFSVYVKNDNNVVKVNFGDPNMEIKRDDPERRANYRARHNCDDPGPKWKANYWSCKMWSSKPVSKVTESALIKYDFDVLDGPKTKRKVGAVVGIKGTSPEDALKQYMIPHGYRKSEMSTKDGIIIVKAQWGYDSRDTDTMYYKVTKSI